MVTQVAFSDLDALEPNQLGIHNPLDEDADALYVGLLDTTNDMALSLYFDVQCSGVTEKYPSSETNGHPSKPHLLHTSFDVTASAETPKPLATSTTHQVKGLGLDENLDF